MKAAVFRGPHQPLTIEDVEVDKPARREVLVKTVASGVCHSDLHFVEGLWMFPPPAVLGHEASGMVEAVGEDVTDFQVGDHVIACLSVFCGHCNDCLTGHPNRCANPETKRAPNETPRLSQDGKPVNQFLNVSSYAEKMLLHENAIVKIRDDVALDIVALIGCGVLTGVGAALNTARVEPGSTVAVFGTGGVGLAAIQGARIAGARRIIAVDVVESKLGFAREMGATDSVDASDRDAVQAIREMTGGGVDYSFEAVGMKKTAEQAFECLNNGGTATVIGMLPMMEKVELPAMLLLSERKMQGSIMGSNRFRVDIPRYIDFYLQGRLHLEEMVSRRVQLEDVNEAFRAMKAGEVARSVIVFN
ncbi:MAG: Zn-dependent alcohol dehydrogenase [Chloroflexota bacterium]